MAVLGMQPLRTKFNPTELVPLETEGGTAQISHAPGPAHAEEMSPRDIGNTVTSIQGKML